MPNCCIHLSCNSHVVSEGNTQNNKHFVDVHFTRPVMITALSDDGAVSLSFTKQHYWETAVSPFQLWNEQQQQPLHKKAKCMSKSGWIWNHHKLIVYWPVFSLILAVKMFFLAMTNLKRKRKSMISCLSSVKVTLAPPPVNPL